MSSSYSGSSSGAVATTFTIPSDGDVVDAASVNTDFQPMADNFARIKKALSYSAARVIDSYWLVSDATIGLFSFNVPAGGNAGTPLDALPDGATVTSVSIKVAPAVHVSLPGTMPKVRFVSVTAAGVGTIQTVTDPSPNVGVYNAVHDITLTLSPSVTLDRTANLYFVQLVQETGANSADGNLVTGSVTVS